MAAILKLLGLNPAPINEIDSLALNFSWNFAGFVLALLVIMPAIYFGYRFEGKNTEKNKRRILLGIRLFWMFLLALVVAGPYFVVSGLVPEKDKIAVVLDTSKSMSIKTAKESGETRFDMMKNLFKRGFLKDIEEKTGVYPNVFTFSENVSPVTKHETDNFMFEADGSNTDISRAIKNVSGNLGESGLIGVIMLTDGVHTTGENPLVSVNNLRTPLYFVVPKDGADSADISISLINPPSLGYLNSGVRIRGEVKAYGISSPGVKVEVLRDGNRIETIDAVFKEQKAEFVYNIACDKEGSFRYDFNVASHENELTSDNNSAGFLLKVVKERLNVMALFGKPSWDAKFIGNAVMTDPNAHFTLWTKVFDNRWICSQDMNPQPAVSKLDLKDGLKDADVLILSDFEYIDLKNYEKEIVSRVESGRMGLYIMASDRTFTHLGYGKSEIENLLPVNISTELLHKKNGNPLLPTRDTEYNFLRIIDDPIQNEEFYAKLPKFEGLVEYAGVKAGAEVLLSSSVKGSVDMLPFMLKTTFGRGNVILSTGGPLWPIGFRLVSSNYGFAPYSALMLNMFKLLANRREDALVSIDVSSTRGYIGKALLIKVWVSDGRRELLSNAQVALSVKDEKGNQSILPCVETGEKGCYEASFVPSTKGIHILEAEAKYRGKELGKGQAEVLAEVATAEFDNPAVNFAQLERLASETGGICVPESEADKIIASLNKVSGNKVETKSLDLRNSWLLLVLLLLLPAAEWYIRRKGGLS